MVGFHKEERDSSFSRLLILSKKSIFESKITAFKERAIYRRTVWI